MAKNASNYAVSLWAFAHVGRLECDSIHVSWLFITRFKHLARLFSLNMSEQCWKMWHWIKHDFISLCNELISIGLLVTEFYMQHNFINATWLQKHYVKYIVNPNIQCKYSSSNYIPQFLIRYCWWWIPVGVVWIFWPTTSVVLKLCITANHGTSFM